MKRSYTTMSGGVLGPRKKRKISGSSGLTSTELSRVREARAIAETLPWNSLNYPIPSGAPSGLYNLATGSKEYKFIDTSFGMGLNHVTQLAVPFGDTPYFSLLNGLTLGTSASQRIGMKIAMKSLYWSMNFGLKAKDVDPTTDIETYNVPVRFMIVYDKQTNGAPFTIVDLLTTLTGLNNAQPRSIDTNSPNNLNNRDRFIVLTDKRFILQSGGPSARHIKKFKRLNTSVAYKSGATVGDITDISSGSLYAICYTDRDFADTALDGNYTVRMSGDIRLRYQDD